jgi:hypothetical protein
MDSGDDKNLEMKYNFVVGGGLLLSLVVPRKLLAKGIASVLVMAVKAQVRGLISQFLDPIMLYRIAYNGATTNILTKRSHECRSILSFFSEKRLRREKSAMGRAYLTDLIAELQRNNR